MKTNRFYILGLLTISFTCGAQQQMGVVRLSDNPAATNLVAKQARLSMQPLVLSGLSVPATPIAEAITPEIQSLARGLENDPLRIYNYVHDHIAHVLYFGSKKGAQLALLERSGNDFD